MRDGVEDLDLLLAVAIAAWALGAVGTLRRPGPARSLWVGMVALGTGEAVHAESIYRRLQAVTGPGWAEVIYHCIGLVAAVAVLDLLHGLLGRPPRTRALTVAAGASAILLAVGPWLVEPPAQVPPALRDEPAFYDGSWASAFHWAVFLAFLAWALTSAAVQCRRYAESAGTRRLRIGMSLISAGTATGLLYVLAHGLVALAWLLGQGSSLAALDEILDAATLGPAVCLVVLGACWSSLATTADRWTQRRTRRQLRARVDALRPLWSSLIQQLPEVSPFATDLRRPASTADGLHWQQQRMAVEIFDALRRLMPYLRDDERDAVRRAVKARGLTGPDAAAAVEHVCLVHTLRLRREGAPMHPVMRTPHLPGRTAAEAAVQMADLARRSRRRRVRTVVDEVLAHHEIGAAA